MIENLENPPEPEPVVVAPNGQPVQEEQPERVDADDELTDEEWDAIAASVSSQAVIKESLNDVDA